MPVVSIPINELKRKLKKAISTDDLIVTCQEIGCDIEELTSIKRIKCLHCNNIVEHTSSENIPKLCDLCGNVFVSEKTDYSPMEDVEVLRIDLLANRPDNFDANGLARTINGYLEFDMGLIEYDIQPSEYQVIVDGSVKEYRPNIACAVVKNIEFSEASLKSIMKLQENIHWALGRNRKFASIGIYDLSKIEKNIYYKAVNPDKTKFIPLGYSQDNQDNNMTLKEILLKHTKGMAYANLLEGFNKYPLLIDEKHTILSMPPIINSEFSKVTEKTTDIFIDVTGFNQEIINKALNIIVASLKSENDEVSIGSVTIKYSDDEIITPDLKPDEIEISYSNCNKIIGINISVNEMVKCLEKMRFKVASMHNDKLIVNIPCYRSDIKHEHDIIEEIAIGYGYKNIKPVMIESFSIGKAIEFEETVGKLRETMAGMGFLEVINLILTSQEIAYTKLNIPVPNNCVIIENPISNEQTILRTELLSGLLYTLSRNTNKELPQEIFEIGNVVFVDENKYEKTVEEKWLGCVICNSKVGFSDIKSVIITLFNDFNINWIVRELENNFYLKGRAAEILVDGKVVGHMGELNPDIITNFGINNPIVAMEINLTKVLNFGDNDV